LFKRITKGENVKIAPEVLRLVSAAAHGSMRDALSILDQLLSFADGEISLALAEDLLGISRTEHHHRLLELVQAGEQKQAAEMVRKMADEGKDFVEFSRGLLEYLQLVLMAKMGELDSESLGLADDDLVNLTTLAEKMSAARLFAIVKEMMKTYRESKTIPVPELPLLASVLYLAGQEEAPEKPVVSRLDAVTAEPREETESGDGRAKAGESSARAESDLSLPNLGAVVERWADVLSKVKEYNHSLIASLRLGRLVGMEGSELAVAFPYNFHKETIDARKNKIVIEQVMEEVFGARLAIKTVLEKDLKSVSAGESDDGAKDLLGEAMKVLGRST